VFAGYPAFDVKYGLAKRQTRLYGQACRTDQVWSDIKRESLSLAQANWDLSLPAGYARRIET